ncbi:hypothetical protein NL676_020228 [Syzygium grande]|nr:hypothetical protein NL676_020228 [Syzygium grande]
MVLSFCKKGLHSFLGLTNFIDSNTTAAAAIACPAAKTSPPPASADAATNDLARRVGLTTATGDMRRQPNVLESSAVKSSPVAKKDPDRNNNMGMFLDDVGEVVDGLMSCTESLGFESSDERRVDDHMMMEDIESMSNKNCDDEWHHVGRTRWREESERRREKKFPPPLSSLNHKGQPSFFLRPVRRDGRLELTGVRIDRPKILRSSRQDGRLRLEFIRDEEEEEEQEVQEELEDEEEQLIEEEGKQILEEEEEDSNHCEVQDSNDSIEYWISEETGDHDEENFKFEEEERMDLLLASHKNPTSPLSLSSPVTNLVARETSEDALREHVSKYGDVSHAVALKERDAKTPKGFGSVPCSSSETSASANLFLLLASETMAGPFAYRNLAPKTKNLVVAGGLTAFVFGVYFYTMRAVGGTDELQTAIDKFEEQRSKQEA